MKLINTKMNQIKLIKISAIASSLTFAPQLAGILPGRRLVAALLSALADNLEFEVLNLSSNELSDACCAEILDTLTHVSPAHAFVPSICRRHGHAT